MSPTEDKKPRVQVRDRYSRLQTQFREIARLFTSVEKQVIAEGRVNASQLDLIAQKPQTNAGRG